MEGGYRSQWGGRWVIIRVKGMRVIIRVKGRWVVMRVEGWVIVTLGDC